MPRQFYTAEQRTAILDAVATARKSKQPWSAAHELAQKQGFRGGLPALQVYVSRSKKTARKTGAVHIPTAPKAVTGSVSELGREIDRLVQQKVNAALEQAIEALKAAM
jgi:DNA-binding MurR/RpiR family transcriptional regulator